VADYYLVREGHGPAWDDARSRREQVGWDEHARFMDALVDEGVAVLGGPVGENLDGDALLLLELDGEEDVRDRLASDPWMDTVLRIVSIEPWTVWLRGR
jgi:hypothetical protein